jgi:hypothetical protein
MRSRAYALPAILLCAIVSLVGCEGQGPGSLVSPIESPLATPIPELFQGARALEFAADQMAFGARPTGSPEGRMTGDYIARQLGESGWSVTEQEFDYLGTAARNIIATRGEGPILLLGAHYDTRRRADRDPHDPTQPVPGANDGASGVAVLLELARVLNVEATGHRVRLAFFDAEDNGGLDGWDWLAGSRYMASQLEEIPAMMVLVDMIGDADQQIYWETNSNADLRERIWRVANELGYGAYFIAEPKFSIIDDHTPFLERGIPAIDIIDFDYPYWHTTADTLDKLSADSLERVGRTLQTWLERGAP